MLDFKLFLASANFSRVNKGLWSISSINNILSSNPMLLEQKENELSEILGYNIIEKELLYIDRNDLINVFNEE